MTERIAPQSYRWVGESDQQWQQRRDAIVNGCVAILIANHRHNILVGEPRALAELDEIAESAMQVYDYPEILIDLPPLDKVIEKIQAQDALRLTGDRARVLLDIRSDYFIRLLNSMPMLES